jgi:hypothetical protein
VPQAEWLCAPPPRREVADSVLSALCRSVADSADSAQLDGQAEEKEGARFTLLFGTARHREWSLNDGQTPNLNLVRVATGTGYHRVEGIRPASCNGGVSDLPPEIPNVTTRDFFWAGGGLRLR